MIEKELQAIKNSVIVEFVKMLEPAYQPKKPLVMFVTVDREGHVDATKSPEEGLLALSCPVGPGGYKGSPLALFLRYQAKLHEFFGLPDPDLNADGSHGPNFLDCDTSDPQNWPGGVIPFESPIE